MAAIAVILGGSAGFVSALVSLVLFSSSWAFAFGLWSLTGIVIASLLIALSLLPHRTPAGLVPELA